jgi:hypothetical protein
MCFKALRDTFTHNIKNKHFSCKTLGKEIEYSSETSKTICKTTLHHIQEDKNIDDDDIPNLLLNAALSIETTQRMMI